MSSLPNTPQEWARRREQRMATRDWVDAVLVVAAIVFASWLAGHWPT